MNARNPFAALATLAALVAPAPILAQEWQGAWNTTYGQIRLVEDGDYVYGDYGNIGTIEGVLVNGKQVLRAVFTRRDTKQTGYVEWVQSGDDGNRITGRWNWTSAPVPDWQEEAGCGVATVPMTVSRQSSSSARAAAAASFLLRLVPPIATGSALRRIRAAPERLPLPRRRVATLLPSRRLRRRSSDGFRYWRTIPRISHRAISTSD